MKNKPKTVLILGASGMLGSGIYAVLKDKYDLILSFHDFSHARLLEEKYGSTDKHRLEQLDLNYFYQDFVERKGDDSKYWKDFLKKIGNVDFIINAIGVTTPHALKDPSMTFFINSAFPHILSKTFGEKLIHITTDCVFDGKMDFPYNENSIKNPIDVYDLSKFLGEPINCLTLRTSIVGRELGGFLGLLEWFLQQGGKTINGFRQCFWNGITTKEFGNVCDRIFQDRKGYPKTGIYHIFSDSLSKYDMLLKFQEKYKIDCEIIPDDSMKINRTLSTIYPVCSQLEIPSFSQMLEEL